jgi:hypothetical protein
MAAGRQDNSRIAVWFDRPSDCLCFADRLDERCKDGEPIPPDAVVRIPLKDSEDFIETLTNHLAVNAIVGEDFTKILWGIQKQLDSRAKHAIELSEHVRSQIIKTSGGTADRNNNEIVMRVETVTRLRQMRDVVGKQRERVEEGKATKEEAFDLLTGFFLDQRMYEA